MLLTNINAGDMVRKNVSLTAEIRVTGLRWLRARLWLGSRILKLAALVIGCGIEIKGPV